MRCGHMRRPAFWSLLLAALCAATCATPAYPAAAARSSLADAVTTTPAAADSSLSARPHASLAAPDVGHAQLREQLQLESADNAANKAAIAAQAEMLDVLSRQQAQILAELQRLRPGETAPAVVPGLGW